MTAAFMLAKMEPGDPHLVVEGCHGLWELAANRDNHADLDEGCMAALLKELDSDHLKVSVVHMIVT